MTSIEEGPKSKDLLHYLSHGSKYLRLVEEVWLLGGRHCVQLCLRIRRNERSINKMVSSIEAESSKAVDFACKTKAREYL